MTWQGDVSPAGSKTAAWYQMEIMGTREAQYALPTVVGVCSVKPMNGKTSQMAYWESDQFIVLMKQGNACGGKGLTVEPLRPGHILRTLMRVKDGNKTVLITYPKKKGGGGSSEEPDEGNLHVRFCEGAHSNLGAITPTKRCAMSPTRQKYFVEKLSRQKRYLDNQMKMMEQLLKTENRWRSNEKVESTLP